MFGLAERPYPEHVLISFWCYSENKNFDFLRFRILADISVVSLFSFFQQNSRLPTNHMLLSRA